MNKLFGFIGILFGYMFALLTFIAVVAMVVEGASGMAVPMSSWVCAVILIVLEAIDINVATSLYEAK